MKICPYLFEFRDIVTRIGTLCPIPQTNYNECPDPDGCDLSMYKKVE